MAWKIELYESGTGQQPVEKFLRSLQPSTIAKFRNQLNLLAEYGPNLGMPNAKPIGDGLFELRVRGKEEVRSLYVFHVGNKIVILHAFKKKTMAISNSDLKIAQKRKQEIIDNI